MPRPGVIVRGASLTDVPEVARLIDLGRREFPGATPLGNTGVDVLEQRLRAFLESVPGRISIAESDSQAIGIAIGQLEQPGLFSETTWLEVEVLLVVSEWRRHGTGHALMVDQARYATSHGAERIVTLPVSGARSEARFLSRLGFASVGPRRSIETALLLRRLERPDSPRSAIESLIARRRAMHPTTPIAGIPLGPAAHEDAVGPEGPSSRRQVRRADATRRSDSSQISTT